MVNSNVGTANQDMVIEGYAIIFNTISDDLGGFKEVISPQALEGVDISDVKCLINHDYGYVLGRTKAGTLELSIDNKGLYFKCYLPNTSYARDIYENIKVENVNQCSFFYTLPPKPHDNEVVTWKKKNGEYIQIINRIDELLEVSIVTIPAYQNTSVVVGQRNKTFEEHKTLESLELFKIQNDIESLRIDT